jgi:nucleoside-diphosphate-sugar epimerase
MTRGAAKSIIFGPRGLVGGCLIDQLVHQGETPVAVSRTQRDDRRCDWILGDLAAPESFRLPESDVIYCATNARVFATALPALLRSGTKRIVVLSSSSVFTKQASPDAEERASIRELIEAEARISALCEEQSVEWTILRPTLIYREGLDRNVTQIAHFVRRFRMLPLYGRGLGLRQPVHAEDLAAGMISAARSSMAANKGYCVPGPETLSYREMAGRIFDALQIRRRLLPLPPAIWETAFGLARPFYPHITMAMGSRMNTDLAFDDTQAKCDFNWGGRQFYPKFPSPPNRANHPL